MLFRDKIGERAKRASLEEDENTRDESTPAKWPQTATSTAGTNLLNYFCSLAALVFSVENAPRLAPSSLGAV